MQFVQLLPLLGIALIFWLLLIRPAQRRQRELSRMQSALEVGDEVMLTSGVYAVVHQVDEDTLLAEVAAGVQIKVARGAVGQVLVSRSDVDPTRETPHEES